MSANNQTIWGIHGGKGGTADQLFMNMPCVAIGWKKCGDLTKIGRDKAALKSAVVTNYPDVKPGAIPVYAGILYRFAFEMAEGDLVVYPSKIDKQVHIGRITGPYKYDPNKAPDHPHLHPVEWLTAVPRPTFSQGALYEIGSAVTLFQVRNYANEFVAVVGGDPPPEPEPPIKEVTFPPTVQAIEQATRDFILKQLSQELKGHPFAAFVANLMVVMGYRTQLSPPGPDGGIDILAHKDALGIEPPIIKVQVKSTAGSVGDPDTSALYGKVADGEFGLLVTLGSFTKQARSFATTKSNLRLIDGDGVVDLVLLHYDQLDSRYKGLLPLKRVFIPEVLDEDAN